jgi:hypothetical protein
MKKILVVLAAITLVLTINIPVAFAGKGIIPFWQNGGNVNTLISIVGPRPESIAASTSTGATVTITLYSTDTASGYTISSTGAGAGGSIGTAGQTFATATFQNAGYNTTMIVDTAQIGSSFATIVWSTGSAPGFHATNAKFGYGVVNTGTAGANEFTGWVAVYGGTNPAGFTVQITDAADGTLMF